jgi:dienelactone hydrolase
VKATARLNDLCVAPLGLFFFRYSSARQPGFRLFFEEFCIVTWLGEVSMMRRRIAVAVPVLAFVGLALSCVAQNAPGMRVVDLTAADGTALKATFFAAAKPGPGVIMLHQCNRQRKVWDELAGSLSASGINVLTLDFRGFGDSGGTPLDKLTPQEAGRNMEEIWPGDVDLALKYLESQPGVSHDFIGAGGASCGVNQAVQLARRHAEVNSLVLLSEGTDRAGREFLRKSPKLPLFMAAADDDPDLGVVEIMQWLGDLSPDTSNKLVHYTTGGHGVEMFAAHKELPGMIVDWFRATLKDPPSVSATRAAGSMSAESRLLELLDQPDELSKAAAMYAEEHRRDPKSALFSEIVLNRIGYEHLVTGDNKGAIEIFKLNVTANPNSPNVYDSLGDAYLADGQKDLARENAKKTLELLATDTTDSQARRDGIKANAEQKLK